MAKAKASVLRATRASVEKRVGVDHYGDYVRGYNAALFSTTDYDRHGSVAHAFGAYHAKERQPVLAKAFVLREVGALLGVKLSGAAREAA